ncbi:MAG: ABC transporter substrate-binding protein [Xanthobacteraceae bacterium]|nr:MAG: ABC transporter substrate-binding protein [Xanthobacteraceae bacterium]
MRKLLAAAVIAVPAVSGAAYAQNVKIGSVLSLTGPASFLGDPEVKTLQLYIDRINKAGGLLGKKIEFINYDDASDAAKANAFTKRLIDDDKVDVIIGGSTTGSTMSMVPLVEKAEMPFISLAGAVVIIEPVKKWVFKTPHTDRMAAEKIFIDMKKRGLTKIALISESSGFGQSGRKESIAAAPKYGIEIIMDETYALKDTDMTPQLTKVKNNPAVQAILVFGLGQGPAIVNKNYAQLGMKVPNYHGPGVCAKEFIALSGDAANGVRLPCAALLVADNLPANDPQKKVVTEYIKSYTEANKADVSTFGGCALDGLMIWVEAVKRAGSFDKAKVRDEIEKTKNLAGTAGVVNMSANDHLGLDLSAFRLLEIKKGNWTLTE